MGYEQLIQIAADALGISPQARAVERERQSQYYNQALDSLGRGVSLKEGGFDPKVVEKTLGPDYAAHLMGIEKTQAFNDAVKARQFNEQLRNTAQSYITAPETQTVEGITPEEASGFFPKLRGEGINPASEIATAALTRPNYHTLEQRIESMKPQTTALLYGAPVAAQGTAGRALEQVSIPGVQQENQRIGIAAQNAETQSGQLGLAERTQNFAEHQTRVENVQKRRTSRQNAIGDATRTLAITHPGLTGAQYRKLAKYYASEGTGEGVSDIPGVVRGAANGMGSIGAKKAYDRLNQIADRIPAIARNTATLKQVPRQEQLDGDNDAALKEFVLAAHDYLVQSGEQPDPARIAELVAARTSFAQRQGSKVVAVPFSALTPDERQAKVAVISQVLANMPTLGSAQDYLNRRFGEATSQPGAAPGEAQSQVVPSPTPSRPLERGGTIFEPPIVMPRPGNAGAGRSY